MVDDKNITTTTSAVNSITGLEAIVASMSKISQDRQADFVVLQELIQSIKQAIEADELDLAKTEIARFETSWRIVEADVKSKLTDAHQAIEDMLKSLVSGINTQQGHEALLARLQKLRESIDLANK
jgi:anti-sigma28 factor (negative regulator of flagellin synthesis)